MSLSSRPPRVIAHRGASRDAPENTLAALRAAHDQSAGWVEFDVKLTRDGTPVLMHDETLERTTNGHGRIADMDLAAVLALDAGRWFGEPFAGEPVPTLEQALEVLIELGMGCNIELKPCPGWEVETAEAALDMASRVWPDDSPPPLISSFAVESLVAARDLLPSWPRGLLLDERPDNWSQIAEGVETWTIHVNWRRETRDSISAYLDSGRPVLVYTVNDVALARTLLSWGVSSVITDTPGAMAAVLAGGHA